VRGHHVGDGLAGDFRQNLQRTNAIISGHTFAEAN
jgi:hypothetical protein